MREVIPPVGTGFAHLRIREVVRSDFPGLPLGAILAAPVFLGPQRLFLLRLDRNRRASAAPVRGHPAIDRGELRSAIWRVLAVPGLAIRWSAVAGVLEQLPPGRVADHEPLLAQVVRQIPQTFTCPAQGRHRIPPTCRLHQGFERRYQRRLGVDLGFASRPGLALPPRFRHLAVIQFLEAVANRTVREPSGLRDCRDPPTASRPRFGCGPASSSPFVQIVPHLDKLAATPCAHMLICHPPNMPHAQCL